MSKLTISGYSDENRSSLVASFKAYINPEKVSTSSSITINDADRAPNATQDSDQPDRIENRTVSFELLLDGTGVIPNSQDVADSIQSIREVVWDRNNEIHRPNYLKLGWGSVLEEFKCMLQSMRVEYVLFDVSGHPLRAKVQLDFVEHENPANAVNGQHSPDMSRIHTVRVGDSLPQLCKDYYDKPYLYPVIAAFNKLVNFRNLEVGSQIYFPPLEK